MIEVRHPERVAKWLTKQIMFGATSAALDYEGNALGTWPLRAPKDVAKKIIECALKNADLDIHMASFDIRTYKKKGAEQLGSWDIEVFDPLSDDDEIWDGGPNKPVHYSWQFWSSDHSDDILFGFVDAAGDEQLFELREEDLKRLQERVALALKKE